MEKIVYDRYGNELKPGHESLAPQQQIAKAIRQDPRLVAQMLQEIHDIFSKGARNDLLTATNVLRELANALEIIATDKSITP
jgi:hypothetical protein